MIVSGNSGTEFGPPWHPATDAPRTPVCVDWSTDIVLDGKPHLGVDAVAMNGLAEATTLTVDVPGRSLGRVICGVVGCSVECTVTGFRIQDSPIIITGVEYEDDQTGFDNCINRQRRTVG